MNFRRLALTLLSALAVSCASAPRAQTTAAAPSAQSTQSEHVKESAKEKENAIARRFCDALHRLPAERRQECCPSSPAVSLVEMCTSELSAALARGSVTLDGAAVDRCAAAMRNELEGCGWVTPLSPPVPAECSALLHGTLDAGNACVSSLECTDGLFCRGAAAGRKGVCAPPARAETPCSAPYDNLATFAGGRGDPRHGECEGRCFKGQCYPLADTGGACISSAFCRSGLTCDDGKCADLAVAKLGEPCSKVPGCTAGLFCAPEGRCTALRSAGEACASFVECRSLRCDKPGGAQIGVCGDPCATLDMNPKLLR